MWGLVSQPVHANEERNGLPRANQGLLKLSQERRPCSLHPSGAPPTSADLSCPFCWSRTYLLSTLPEVTPNKDESIMPSTDGFIGERALHVSILHNSCSSGGEIHLEVYLSSIVNHSLLHPQQSLCYIMVCVSTLSQPDGHNTLFMCPVCALLAHTLSQCQWED